jgi:hypothetical protein
VLLGEKRFLLNSSLCNYTFAASGALLAREWAKFNYGVFSETGFSGDTLYPDTFTGK